MHECHDATGEEVFFFLLGCNRVDPHLEPSLVGESHSTLAADPQRGGWNLSKKKITLTHLVLLRKK